MRKIVVKVEFIMAICLALLLLKDNKKINTPFASSCKWGIYAILKALVTGSIQRVYPIS